MVKKNSLPGAFAGLAAEAEDCKLMERRMEIPLMTAHRRPIRFSRAYPAILAGAVASFGMALHGAAPAAPASPPASSAKVDFNREIRPILSENCFKCHGPDDGARKSKLRFDLREAALKPAKSEKIAIVPGAPEKSEMIARITTSDEDDRMPPLKTGKKLTPAQIESLRRWIAQGAPYAT